MTIKVNKLQGIFFSGTIFLEETSIELEMEIKPRTLKKLRIAQYKYHHGVLILSLLLKNRNLLTPDATVIDM